MQQERPYRTYPGRNDIEKAQAYLMATKPNFRALTRYEQIRQAGDVVRLGSITPAEDALRQAQQEQGTRAADSAGSAVQKLQAAVDKVDELLSAAVDEDHDAAVKILEGLAQRAIGKRAGKTGSSATTLTAPYASYPGRNDIEKAQGMLCGMHPGFKARDRHQQVRLAGEYVRQFALGGQAAADGAVLARLGAS